MRADVFLYEKGYCESRTKASAACKEGRLYVNGKNITKCSFEISEGDTVELKDGGLKYVGRGGLKMEGAMNSFSLDVRGKTCVDIGASTGGFTDCLLQNGARKVYAVDCGSGQLHPTLLKDERVVNIENFNARNLDEEALGERCDLAVMDVSFISQTLIHGAVKRVLNEGGVFVTLIKPQFEAGKASLGKGGIVKDEKARQNACKAVILSAKSFGFALKGLEISPISGGDGNVEYLGLFILSENENGIDTDAAIKAASKKVNKGGENH